MDVSNGWKSIKQFCLFYDAYAVNILYHMCINRYLKLHASKAEFKIVFRNDSMKHNYNRLTFGLFDQRSHKPKSLDIFSFTGSTIRLCCCGLNSQFFISTPFK